jgi:hypothetical protein
MSQILLWEKYQHRHQKVILTFCWRCWKRDVGRSPILLAITLSACKRAILITIKSLTEKPLSYESTWVLPASVLLYENANLPFYPVLIFVGVSSDLIQGRCQNVLFLSRSYDPVCNQKY